MANLNRARVQMHFDPYEMRLQWGDGALERSAYAVR